MSVSNVAKKQPRSSERVVRISARIPEAGAVSVSGDFSGWSEEGIRMTKGDGDRWEAELPLAPGEYQYRLRVDGRWQDHAEAKRRVPNLFGSENCILQVS